MKCTIVQVIEAAFTTRTNFHPSLQILKHTIVMIKYCTITIFVVILLTDSRLTGNLRTNKTSFSDKEEVAWITLFPLRVEEVSNINMKNIIQKRKSEIFLTPVIGVEAPESNIQGLSE